MRKINFFSAVLSLFLLVPASITWAQTISSQKGLTTAVFTTSSGTIKVYLPDDIRPGDLISGHLIASPSGNNTKQIQNNLTALKKYSIGINNEKFAVDEPDKSFQFLVHADRPLNGPMELINVSGNKVAALTIPAIPVKDQQPAPAQCMIPSHALTGSALRITGPFDGNSSNTNCTLDNKSMQVLAKSPRECIVAYPADATGIKTLTVQESGKQICSQQVSSVRMAVSAGKLDLQKGDNTFIDVSITGLQHLPDTALLTLMNMTTGVVVMLPSNTITIPLAPDSVGSGIFNKRFEVQSLRTGTFSVDVTLDLPEHPGTEAQPNQPTQPQCPGCNCSCSADIIHDGEKDGVTFYRVVVTASCTGQFGKPPCQPCGIVDEYAYEWQVSFSAGDGIESVGTNDKVRFGFTNPKKAPFTLIVKVTVTCSDGSKCSCTATTTSGPPTIPEDGKKCPGCQCECNATIQATDTEGDEWEYKADVIAICAGVFGQGLMPDCAPCKVTDITYDWFLNDDNVAKIKGARNGQSVKVRIIKPGEFIIRVVVTVTCSDGHKCKCGDHQIGIVPDKGCMLTWEEMNEPAMTGGFAPFPLKPQTIRRDEFIALKATGEDEDMLKLVCTKLKECLDDGSTIYKKLAGNVRFEWKITGPGNFVDIGCLSESKTTTGDQVIFKPPYVALPVAPATEAIITTDIELSIIDEAVGQRQDATIHRQLTITTKRLDKSKDNYEITIKETTKPGLDAQPGKFDNLIKQCWPVGNWTAGTPIDKPTILLPAPKDSDKLHPGEWMRLEGKEQTDYDNLVYICQSAGKCDVIRQLNGNYADHLEWTWTVNKGTFAGSNKNIDKGRFVIYKAPDDITAETEIIITLTVEDGTLQQHEGPQSSSIKIRIYPGGIKLDYKAKDWVPDPADPAVIESYLVYKKENKWVRGFEHSCRIQFFELMDVSNQPGICLNAPKLNPQLCRDLKLITEAGQEAFIDTSGRTECAGQGYFMQARTEEPKFSYLIKVHAEDYGAWGFLRSYANINKGEPDNIVGEKPFFKSVPVEKDDFPHPQAATTKGGRPKKMVYPDNRINIPLDIDENHIPDYGWVVEKKAVPGGVETTIFPDVLLPVSADIDDDPPGDGFPGDGLAYYEEYRGFMVIKPLLEHRRTNPKKKDLFLNNENDPPLPIDAFTDATKITVHEISNDQWNELNKKTFEKEFSNYVKNNQRFINFNFGLGHLTSQKGLLLVDGPIAKPDGEIKDVLGVTPSELEEPNKSASPAPPNWNIEVRVDRNKINKLFDPTGNAPLIAERKLKQVVAHELSHACNVYHHGDNVAGLVSGNKACIMRYDNFGVKNEVPGTILCMLQAGADKKRGECAKQLRISGRIVASSHGYPTR